jgi:glutamyl-tRNA synthetase
MDTETLAVELKPFVQKLGVEIGSDEYFQEVVGLLKSRLHFRKEFVDFSSYFFKDPEVYDPKVVKKRWKDDSANLLLEFVDKISKLSKFNAAAIEQTIRGIAEEHEVGSGRIIHPVRLAVSGTGIGPGLFDMLQVLGKETVIKRVKKAIDIVPTLQQ